MQRKRSLATLAAIAGLVTTTLGVSGTAAVPVVATAATPTAADTTASWLPTTPDTWPLGVSQQTTDPVQVTSGITYSQTNYQTVQGPQRGSVLQIDASNPNVAFNPVMANNVLASNDETVSSMAARTGAVAGTNGDYFQIGTLGLPAGQGQPTHLLVSGGQVVTGGLADDCGVLGYTSSHTFTVGRETFSGTVTAGSTSSPLSAVNEVVNPGSGSQCNTPTGNLGLVLVTSQWSTEASPMDAAAPVAELSVLGNDEYQVTSIVPSESTLPAQQAGQAALIGEDTASAAFVNGLTVGEDVNASDGVTPNPGLQSAVGGGFLLLDNGQVNPEIAGINTDPEATTVVGVSADGTQMVVGVFDGQQASIGEGFGYAAMASWLLDQGMTQGIFFDSGGSSDMVARLPGQAAPTVQNSPSDGQERQVAECLCFYSTETAPGAATTAAIDRGQPLTVLAGSTVPVPVSALDADGNPASETPSVTVSSPGASVGSATTGTGGTIEVPVTAGSQASTGTLTVTAGGATASIPYDVVTSLSGLTVSPAEPDIDNLGTQQLSLSGTAADGSTVTVPTDAATWSTDTPTLGTISTTGLYSAAMSGSGLVTVTATAGGASGTSSVAVGTLGTVVDTMTDVENWSSNGDGGATVSLSASTTQIPPVTGATGSMDVQYSYPGPSTGGVQQAAFYPNNTLTLPPAGDTADPTAIGLWVKGSDGAGTGSTNLELAESYAQVDGTAVTLYPSTVTYDGWQLITAQLPAGLQFPLTLSFLDFLVIAPTTAFTGDLYVADLEALASPRVAPTPTYTAIPDNPSWLQYEESPSDFTSGGTTIAAFDDAHLEASDHDTTGAVVTSQIAKNIRQLPRNAQPQMIQAGGDMANTGSLADLQYSHSVLQSFGIPFHDTVGNHETTQGANPENDDFAQVYGPTHYQYDEGAADVIDLDSSQIGITESDPYQDPDQEQWAWLVQELDSDTSPVTIITTHVPAYDPHTVENSQFSNRYEAAELESLVQIYQQTHSETNVILLFGHARGFAENLLDAQGNNVPDGIPNFVVADAGSAAYAPADQGGFYHYALFHILPDGTVQFAVQPVLSTIAVAPLSDSLAAGASATLTATGTSPTGDDLAPLQMPIQDPASHVWSSSDPSVASVDPVTGAVTGVAAGTATISVVSGGVTGSTTVTVG
jgi:hypothetical protein